MNTEDQQNPDQRRSCGHCGQDFVPSTKKHTYCSTTCRVAHLRQKKMISAEEQEQLAQNQAAELSALKEASVSRTETVQTISQAWQVADQAYNAQFMYCQAIEAEKVDRQKELDILINPVEYARRGAWAGGALVVIVMVLRFDGRRRNPLGVSYWVISLIALVFMSMIGYAIGQSIERLEQANDERFTKPMTELPPLIKGLAEKLAVERTGLEALRTTRSQIAKFDSQIVTTTDETRGS